MLGRTPGVDHADKQADRRADGQAAEHAQTDAMTIDRITMDAALGPRDGHSLIAGETARIGLRITGGRPPYRIHLRAERQGRPLQPEQSPPLDARVTPSLPTEPSGPSGGPTASPRTREIALQAILDARAPSGIYRVRATVRDQHEARATSTSEDITIIGSDAPVRPVPVTEPFVEILDLAQRRRRAFVRGERVAIHARLPGAGATADLVIVQAGLDVGPAPAEARTESLESTNTGLGGTVLLRATGRPLSAGGDLLVALDIPRLARPGDYQVLVAASRARDTHAAGTRQIVAMGMLRVAGTAFAPVRRLTLDALSIHAGADGRSPRTGRLQRGERLHIEVRVGGARAQITGMVRLRAQDGRMVAESPIGQGPIEITTPAPDARVFLAGTWTIPVTITPGRYQLQAEVVEGEHVSARYRDILVE